jgi:Mg2+ and Co2+ transporter CorA
VLDKGSFVPVKQKLGWINDNLQVYESFPVEDVITGLASLAGRRQMFQALEAESDMIIAKSSEVIKKAGDDVVANMESLVEGYNQEIPDLIEFIKKTNKKISKQKGRVALLNKQKLDIERFLHETEQGIDAVGKSAGDVKAEIARLRARVGRSINDSTVALREMEENVGKKISQLESEKHALLEQLKRAHRIFS